MSRNLQSEKDKENDVHSTRSNLNLAGGRSSVCNMDLKLQNQLSKYLSPEFDVRINDVGEIVNILNVIKAKCASTPEKFRLLIGLLCEVDLSITNIEEHYEQLLVKNRIFHLLRIFPDVAHPLLDVIARATNRCCPLASLPVTIGRIEEERQARNNKFLITCNNTVMPGTAQLLQHSTCLRLSAHQNNPTTAAPVTGIQQAGVLSPHRLSVVTQPTAHAPSVRVVTVTSPAGQPLVGGNQLTEFDMSRRMYDQVPPSLLHSSLPAGVFNSSGARESPTDIQKRILLQQQQRLRLQLELLQAQRLQQACLRNLTFGHQKTSNAAVCTIPNTPMAIMEQPVPASSTVIGQSAQPMRMTRSCSQLSRQPIRRAVGNRQSGRDIQALDLRLPERRLASENVSSKNNTATLNRNCETVPKKLSVKAGNDDESGNTEKEDATCEKEGELCLSQVGQHCIMVSVRDGSNSSETGTPQKGVGSEVEPPKCKTRQKHRKGRAGHGCRGALINVKKLCHMQDTEKNKKHKNNSTASRDKCSPTAGTSVQELKRDTQSRRGHGSCAASSTLANVNNNNSNNKCDSDSQDCSTQPHGLNSSRKRKSQRTSKSSKRQRKSSSGIDALRGIIVSDSEPVVDNSSAIAFEVGKESVPLDLSCTFTPTNNTGNLTATHAAFEPTTGLWQRKPDDEHVNTINQSQRQGFEFSQIPEVRSPESAYLLYSGCDDEAWYQSSQSDEVDIVSNQSSASPAVGQSNASMSSPMQPGLFFARLVHSEQQKSLAAVGNGTRRSAAASAVAAAKTALLPAVKRKLPRTRPDKKKNKR